jgi:aminobutyraldehyde dehydrogenase
MPRSPGRNNRVVNEMPHGGLKMSGYGKDLSMYALEDYTVPRHVMVKL